MKYQVVIEKPAREEIDRAYYWGCEKWGAKQAQKWFNSLMKEIAKLETFPNRHPLAPESEEFYIEIRQIIFQRYRILFLVGDDSVNVLHFREAYHNKTTEEE
ncbi:MAG: type II toxin-antitoxin system RelE/ParE family toxin [Acidobacteria bacterium]|nr:type II toxin-antitoxin system RelE/ParE family toxin [Acidobacteriota bacterium]